MLRAVALVMALLLIPAAGAFEYLGEVYTAKTDDGVKIKLLRYHPPGEGVNDGVQPVVLFSGLLCNMNEYLTHTPPELKDLYKTQLPSELADWAVGMRESSRTPCFTTALHTTSGSRDTTSGS